MTLNKKIRFLIILLSFRAIFDFLGGVTRVKRGDSFGDYIESFIYAGAMIFIIYLIYTRRDRLSYWFAALMSAFVVVRFAGIMMVDLYYGRDPSLLPQVVVVLGVIYAIAFGVIPLVILASKDLRDAFLR